MARLAILSSLFGFSNFIHLLTHNCRKPQSNYHSDTRCWHHILAAKAQVLQYYSGYWQKHAHSVLQDTLEAILVRLRCPAGKRSGENGRNQQEKWPPSDPSSSATPVTSVTYYRCHIFTLSRFESNQVWVSYEAACKRLIRCCDLFIWNPVPGIWWPDQIISDRPIW